MTGNLETRRDAVRPTRPGRLRVGFAAALRPEAPWLASGFLLAFCSGFGQTYFIALFAGQLKADLTLTDGQFGTLYMGGTLASAALLVWAGKLADRIPIRRIGVAVMIGLAATALGMAGADTAWMLALVLFGLRFFGQGMLTHVAVTAMGRWFSRKRGRAMAIAVLGLPAAEALLPPAAVAAIGLIGWRLTWVAAAILLVALAVPLFLALLRRERMPGTPAAAALGDDPEGGRRHWTRGEVLRSPLFYALLAGVMAPPFVLTGVFFNQVGIVEMKGWQLAWFAASFPVMAVVQIMTALVAGWLVDRIGARRLLPAFLLPLALATILLTYVDSAYILPVFMALVGIVLGSASTVQGALWVELYGSRHLGAIRAPATAAMVFSTALAPGLIGVLMDAGVTLDLLLLAMAVYSAAAGVWMMLLTPRLSRLAGR